MATAKKEESSNIGKDMSTYFKTAEAGVSESDKARARAANVATDKVMSVSANLAQLLPTSAVLAYQSLSAATFTNQGECFPSNWWLSLGLVVFLAGSCVFFSFTDSVRYKGKVYYGVALPGRLKLFNMSKKEERKIFKELRPELRKRGLTYVDFVHAIFSAVVFLSVACSDVGLQKCFFPKASRNQKELLKNFPLGTAVLSSFIFMMFPTNRSGIGFESHGSNTTSTSSNSGKTGETIPPSSPPTK